MANVLEIGTLALISYLALKSFRVPFVLNFSDEIDARYKECSSDSLCTSFPLHGQYTVC
jgi:hypothetical protein